MRAPEDALEVCQTLLIMATEAFGREPEYEQKALPIKNPHVIPEVMLPLLAQASETTHATVLCKLLQLARVEANAQTLAQAGATSALIRGFGKPLLDVDHALHSATLELFTLLGAQSLTPQELRQFLRLDTQHIAQATVASLDSSTADDRAMDADVEPVLLSLRDRLRQAGLSEYGDPPTPSSVSSATTDTSDKAAITSQPDVPKQHLQALLAIARAQDAACGVPFMEFSMAAPFGYASIFLPSVARLPRTSSSSAARDGHAERVWPPASGFTFSCWVSVERWGLDAHPVRLLTAFSPSEPEANLLSVEVGINRGGVTLDGCCQSQV